MTAESDPLSQATEQLPERWYEAGPFAATLPAGLGVLALAYVFRFYGPHVNAWVESASGLAAYGTAAEADRHTSASLAQTIDAARSEGLAIPYNESNTLFGRVHNSADMKAMLRNPKALALEAILAVGSFITWTAAAPLCAVRGIPALNNHRKLLRVNKAREISRLQD